MNAAPREAAAAVHDLAGDPPGSRLQATFERIARERMVGMPFLNPRLQVEAFGLRAWQGVQVGALVTPWSINLVILPDAASTGAVTTAGCPDFRVLACGQSQVWRFPSGAYEFHGHHEPGLGPYQQCSLFSPAQEFATQQDARDAAAAALDELFREPAPPAAEAAGANVAAARRGAAEAVGLSRRQLLLGRPRERAAPAASTPGNAAASSSAVEAGA